MNFYSKFQGLWWILFFLQVLPSKATSIPCNLRKYPNGYVCVCNTTYCDLLNENVDKPDASTVVIVSSSQEGLRFNVSTFTWPSLLPGRCNIFDHLGNYLYGFGNLLNLRKATVTVNPTITYQTIEGFGGAFTGAVSYNLDHLSDNLKDHLYKSYYSSAGIGFNFMRIPIGGCDFDLAPWAYNESPENDANLSNFTSLDHRDVELIKKITQLQLVTGNNDIRIFGSTWSPPKWMKTNNDWTGPGSLKEQYYKTWADYHVRFVDLMAKGGITLWGITTGNEPFTGVIGSLLVHLMNLGWTPRSQAIWVNDYLTPALKMHNINLRILAGDDQRLSFPWWFDQMALTRSNVMDNVAGFAVHSYMDSFVPPLLLDATHATYPNKLILNTESSLGASPLDTRGPILGSWARAEQYILSYIQDFQHWVNGWIDWNLLLNEQGGPSFVNNFIDAAILVNATSDEAYKQPIFYAIGHFSRFIYKKSIRIKTISSDPQVNVVGFLRPDSKVVLVIYNRNQYSVQISLIVPHRTKLNVSVPGKSIHSVIFTNK